MNSVFPRWMYHKEKDPALAKDAEHEKELRKKAYGWHSEVFAEAPVEKPAENYHEHMAKWESKEEKEPKEEPKARRGRKAKA